MTVNMEEVSSCKIAMDNCTRTKTFSIAHLYKEEKAMEMHIHDCCELYYSISGGKQFLIDNPLLFHCPRGFIYHQPV